MIKSLEPNLNYDPDGGIYDDEYKKAEFNDKYNSWNSEDLIKGQMKNGLNIKMSEVSTENESTDARGNTTSTIVFHGLYAIINTPKDFNCNLLIRQNKLNLFGNEKTSRLNNIPKLQLDSPEFEKYFDVYTTNNIIAMQILTADVMNYLVEYQTSVGTQFDITIKDNKIYLRFSTKELFETPDLKKNALDKNILYNYFKILESTFTLTNKMLKIIYDTKY